MTTSGQIMSVELESENTILSDAEKKKRFLDSLALDGVDATDLRANEAKRHKDAKLWLEKLKSLLIDVESPTMLDVGSGDGEIARYCRGKLGVGKLTCYDICPPNENNTQYEGAFLSKVPEIISAVNVNLFDGVNIPELDDSYDVVTAIYVLHHAGKVQIDLLKEMRRVSKKYIVVIEDNNEPEFQHRNKLHDINGLFRTSEEWHCVWKDLKLKIVHEGKCNPSATVKGPQYFYIMIKDDHVE